MYEYVCMCSSLKYTCTCSEEINTNDTALHIIHETAIVTIMQLSSTTNPKSSLGGTIPAPTQAHYTDTCICTVFIQIEAAPRIIAAPGARQKQ